MKNYFILFLLIAITIFSRCSSDNNNTNKPVDNNPKNLTIFCVNDVHGQINNFAKIKFIIDQEREKNDVIVVSAGDLFSGNPVVDNYPEKGFPMIDIMNKVGFDIAVLGNHEFDYGTTNLKNRMNQANFDWVCANVDMQNSGVPQPYEYKTIQTNQLRVCFLGLIETNGKKDGTIPSTHPWRVQNLRFERPEDIVSLYSNVKTQENADLYICLSHLGFNGNDHVLGDSQLANKFPYFDIIIGGHSHDKINTTVNDIPIFQSGSYLKYLGKIKLVVKEKNIESINFNLIDLNKYSQFNSELKTIIDSYDDQPYLTDVIGYSNRDHNNSQVGCFYTDALRNSLQVDVCFQNTGGIRSGLNEGNITKREIYEISPFNNGTVIYEMSVWDIKKFLRGSGSGFYYSGIQIKQVDQDVEIRNMQGKILSDDTILRVGINDYIAAVHDRYFPENGEIQNQTDAESIISYLENTTKAVDYPVCDRYFRMQ